MITEATEQPATEADRQIAVEMSSVVLKLGQTEILSGLDLSVAKGEFVSLLGPSGVGKSTILNVVAGFLPVESGTVRLMGRDMTYAQPHHRDLGFIFQEYALFPHMDVGTNIRFPLDMRKIKGAEAERRVDEALEVVGLGHTKGRRPEELSGGQRQRVAIARAMVFQPEILLMDEPLSSLDRQLRDEMTLETRRLQRDLGVTVIYVTHDQTEALSLSDRVGILRNGRIEQIEPPGDVHDRPYSVYGARLCGPLNVEPIGEEQIDRGGDRCTVRLVDSTVTAAAPRPGATPTAFGVRPYLLRLQAEPPSGGLNGLPCTVTSLSLVGNGVRYDIDIGGASDWHVLSGHRFEGVEVGQRLYAVWEPRDSLVLAA